MPGSHAGVTVKVKATPSSTYDPAKLQSVITRCLKDGATATRPVLGKQAVDDLKSILSSSMADDLIPTLFTTLCNVNEKQSQKHRQLALEFLSMVLKRHGGSSTFPSVFLKVLGHLLDSLHDEDKAVAAHAADALYMLTTVNTAVEDCVPTVVEELCQGMESDFPPERVSTARCLTRLLAKHGGVPCGFEASRAPKNHKPGPLAGDPACVSTCWNHALNYFSSLEGTEYSFSGKRRAARAGGPLLSFRDP